MTDKQKRLIKAIHELLPQCEHRMCARHIYADWCKQFRGMGLKKLFWNVVRSTTAVEYEEHMATMLTHCPVGHAAMADWDLTRWCKAFFRTQPKCDIADNNMTETFNGWILEARMKSIVSMLEDIRMATMTRFPNKRDAAMS